jgi:hypothetical protein
MPSAVCVLQLVIDALKPPWEERRLTGFAGRGRCRLKSQCQ